MASQNMTEKIEHNLEKNPGNVPNLEYKIGQEPDHVTFTLQSKKWLQRRTSKQLIVGTALLILVMVSIIVLTLTLLTRYSPPEHHKNTLGGESEPAGDHPDNDPEVDINIIGRRGWIAEPPTSTEPLQNPVSKVIFVETLTASCTVQEECIFLVRHIQGAHKEGLSKWDIKYNFMVGGDGNVYDGRGWNALGATILNCNKNSLGIAFIGTFIYDTPSEKQISAAKKLLNFGVKQGHISPKYKFVYSSQLLGENVDSSRHLEEILETWPHWSSTNYFQNNTLRKEFCNN